jgi:hypothetical protein
MKRILLSAAVLGSLAACSTSNIAQTEVALTIAERLALVYVTQPVCVPAGPPVCSDPAIVAQIKAADAVAYSAVKQAQAGKLDPSQAATEVAALAALIPATK